MNAQRVNGMTHFDLAVNVGKVGKKCVYGYYDFKTTWQVEIFLHLELDLIFSGAARFHCKVNIILSKQIPKLLKFPRARLKNILQFLWNPSFGDCYGSHYYYKLKIDHPIFIKRSALNIGIWWTVLAPGARVLTSGQDYGDLTRF